MERFQRPAFLISRAHSSIWQANAGMLAAPKNLDQLLQLDGAELSHDLLNASLMQQQDSRNNGLGHALGGSRTHIVRTKKGYQNNSSSRRNIFR